MGAYFHDMVVVVVVLFNLFLFDSFALILEICSNTHCLVPCTLPYLLVGRRDHGLAPIISNAATAKPLPTYTIKFFGVEIIKSNM